MIGRCEDPKRKGFHNYGGRGIRVCERWHTFENFLADMGERPEGKTLDRIDVNGNYEPANCRWATEKEQRDNMREPYRMVSYQGREYPIQELAAKLGVNRYTLYRRMIKGFPEETWGDPPLRGWHFHARLGSHTGV